MQRSLVKIPDGWTVGQVIDHCREATDLPDDVYDIFVVDPAGRLGGSVPLGRMLRSKRPVPVLDIIDPDIPSVPATADQAEVAHLFRDKNLVSCPWSTSAAGCWGVIMVDDVVDVIDEAEEDLLKMGGVGIDDMHAIRAHRAAARRVADGEPGDGAGLLRDRPVRRRHRRSWRWPC
jgi:magnesium transporter